MSEQDVRWEQRFSNYNRALDKLDQAVKKIEKEYIQEGEEDLGADSFLDDIIKEGLIKRFEYTFELAWNVMKDYFYYQGNDSIKGSRDAIREAFANKLIMDGDLWMGMIASRIKTAHTYNEDTADDIYSLIMDNYHPAFIQFRETMEKIRSGEQSKLFNEK
mgnify:CR=1 FL=1